VSPDLAELPGDGPVRPLSPTFHGVTYFDASPGMGHNTLRTSWVAEPGFRSTVLLRGARIDAGTPLDSLRFGDSTASATDFFLAGDDLASVGSGGWNVYPPVGTIFVGGAGCYAYQLDFADFSSVIVVLAAPDTGAWPMLRRPLEIEDLRPGDVCPVTPTNAQIPGAANGQGNGPVYPVGGGLTRIWAADPREQGPILVRGRRVDGPGEIRFGEAANLKPELELPLRSFVTWPGLPAGWRGFTEYSKVTGPGCYAYQIDTLRASSLIVFRVEP
jgi:hypothetical protein